MGIQAAMKALDREIQWFEGHRDYFQTNSCADSAIDRLKARRQQVEQIRTEAHADILEGVADIHRIIAGKDS